MSDQIEAGLPKVIDGLAFAKAGTRAVGEIASATLPRLAGELLDRDGSLACVIVGERDKEGVSWLNLKITGTLVLECQRCLKGLAHPVAIQSRLMLVPAGNSWPDEELAEDGFDAVTAEKEMVLASLIEEEVLLALPIAPMHAICTAPAPQMEEQEPSPFAVLAKLKKGV